MILEQSQIKDIIVNNPGKAMVLKGCQYSKKLRKHLYGDGLDKSQEVITGYEKQDAFDMRKKYCRSNKDLFSRLGRPLDKVFTAKGGSIYLNLSDAQQKRAQQLAQDVVAGLSVRKWIEVMWLPHALDDPFGLIFMELLQQQEAVKYMQQGKSFVYPTYKSIHDIYDYLPNGNKLEWVVFTVSATDKKAYGFKESDEIFRVVDDANDYLVKRDNSNPGDPVQILDAYTLTNFFGEVPAVINSDIVDPVSEGCVLSFFDPAIELADEFLLDNSIKRVHKFLHGFPKYSEFADDCPECRGTGYSGADKCGKCKGTGKYSMTRVSDIKLLAWPEGTDTVILPKDVGGYISPDKVFFDISTAELQALEDAMTVTLWGNTQNTRTQPMTAGKTGEVKTATQVVGDMKPQADRLAVMSEMAEKRHKFILDSVIRLNLSLPGYGGSSVNYGRRYLLEGPDEVWTKYSDARTKGAPQNVLDSLLNEYIEAQYQTDPVGLLINQKLMYVEPFVHLTAQQVQTLLPSEDDYKAKLYFSEWLATVNESVLITSDIATLRQELLTFASAKQLPQPAPAKGLPPAA